MGKVNFYINFLGNENIFNIYFANTNSYESILKHNNLSQDNWVHFDLLPHFIVERIEISASSLHGNIVTAWMVNDIPESCQI